jgi:CBS domain-containing protein
MDLAEIMATTFATVAPNATLADASRRMIDVDTGAAVVVDDGELVGMISERDLLRVFRDGGEPDQPVAERMSRDVLHASPTTSIPEAMAIMVDGKFRHLPVVKDGRVVGMVSMRDLMAWASLTIRSGGGGELGDVDTAELLATINRMRTGAA